MWGGGGEQPLAIHGTISFTCTEEIHFKWRVLFTSTRPKTTFLTCVCSISDDAVNGVCYTASSAGTVSSESERI